LNYRSATGSDLMTIFEFNRPEISNHLMYCRPYYRFRQHHRPFSLPTSSTWIIAAAAAAVAAV
jgi:hypothetical protein